MRKNELVETIADLFKLFGDATCLSILNELVYEELSVGDISKRLDMSQSAISHQLKVLRNGNLVKVRRSGKNIYYSVSDLHVKKILSIGKKML